MEQLESMVRVQKLVNRLLLVLVAYVVVACVLLIYVPEEVKFHLKLSTGFNAVLFLVVLYFRPKLIRASEAPEEEVKEEKLKSE